MKQVICGNTREYTLVRNRTKVMFVNMQVQRTVICGNTREYTLVRNRTYLDKTYLVLSNKLGKIKFTQLLLKQTQFIEAYIYTISHFM